MTTTKPLRILMTGANSGIGEIAARQLQDCGHVLTVVCRSRERADQTMAWIQEPSQILIGDLSDLNAVNKIAAQLCLDGQSFDVLVLNAGLQYAGVEIPRWSLQGFELTWAVNHLAHQCLLQRVLPLIRDRPSAPRVVITASEVHNPKTGGGRVGQPAGLGTLAGMQQGAGASMVDGTSPFNADKAYKDSKLCNLLMGLELSRQQPQLPVICWSPGLVIPRTKDGFFRESRKANPFGQAVFGFIARDIVRLTERPERAGELLVSLVLGHHEATGMRYMSNHVVAPGKHVFQSTEPSPEASDIGIAHTLWKRSEELIKKSLKSAA
jgi:protochlorophyllide reductase